MDTYDSHGPTTTQHAINILTIADRRQCKSGPDPKSLSGVHIYGSRLRIRTLDMDDFENLTGISLFKVTLVVKFSRRSDQFVQRYEPNCGKNAQSRNVEESFKKFLDPYPEANDIQNL